MTEPAWLWLKSMRWSRAQVRLATKLDKRFQEASVEDADLDGLFDWFGTEATRS